VEVVIESCSDSDLTHGNCRIFSAQCSRQMVCVMGVQIHCFPRAILGRNRSIGTGVNCCDYNFITYSTSSNGDDTCYEFLQYYPYYLQMLEFVYVRS
jgi:hypothetical protein